MQIPKIDFQIINKNSGLIFLVSSLLFYFLLKLPFNLSCKCISANEGYYFIFGHNLYCSFPNPSGPIFVFFYWFILNIFGFGTISIIVLHFIQTIFVSLIGVLLYLIVLNILKSKFYAGLSVLFWILIMITPIGIYGPILECTSNMALDAEYFCVFYSLSSIYILMLNLKNEEKSIYAFMSGALAACSIASKASGTTLVVAVIIWFIYLFYFKKAYLKNIKNVYIFFFIGLFSILFLINLCILLQGHNLILYWTNYYFIGSYHKEYLSSIPKIAKSLIQFMFRFNNSISNFSLFSLAFIGCIWGLIRSLIIKNTNNHSNVIVPLLSIWAIGNVCAVIAPGIYASYYYTLVWTQVAFFIVLIIRDLFFLSNKLKTLLLITIIVSTSTFFIHRIIIVTPTYIKLIEEHIHANAIIQKESFENSVVLASSNDYDKRRVNELKAADLINSLLPNKKDTFYILNFTTHQDFGANIYIHARRLPPTPLISDHLCYTKYLNKVLIPTIDALTKNPPKLFIFPVDFYIRKDVEKGLNKFLDWFDSFSSKNYHLKMSFTYPPTHEAQRYYILEQNQIK